MTRVTEALRRAHGGAKLPAAVPGQTAFEPAWRVAPDGQEAARPIELVERSPLRPSGSDSRAGLVALSSAWRERLATGPDGDPALVEQFRRLAGIVVRARESANLRSVMVTSATPGEGKTLTAVNLALVLAESYRCRVLLVDADLRNPSIPNVGDSGVSGLSEALRSSGDQQLIPASLTPRLMLLPAGQPIANSLEALTSPRMRDILADAVEQFDCVVLDAPPIGSTADAHLLAQMTGGTLFVVRAGQTQYASVTKALELIGRDHLLGVVLNGVESSALNSYYYRTPRGEGAG